MERTSRLNSLNQAVQEYFHIQEPTEDEVPESRQQLDQFLRKYEAALLLDANYYRDQFEIILKEEREGTVFSKNREINHFQFPSSGDRFTNWIVEMKLEKPKNNSLWFPNRTTFVKVSKDIMPSLKDQWIDTNWFLHPLLNRSESVYDQRNLREYVLSYTAIDMTNGLIFFITNQTKDDSSHEVFQRIRLNRKNSPPLLPNRPDATLKLIQPILEHLPIGKVEIHQPASQ